MSTGPNDGDNWVRYYADPATAIDDDGNLDVASTPHKQEIHLSKCGVTTSGLLLDFTRSPSSNRFDLGLVSNGIGTQDRKNCATSNGQIESSDAITISLGSFFKTNGDLDGNYVYAIDRAEIDIEGKQNAQLGYRLDDGADPEPRPLNPSSDNGPDAGLNDNVIQVFTPGPDTTGFTEITLFPAPESNSKALISIEGGGDAGDGAYPCPAGVSCERDDLGVTQTLFSVVKLFDGELGCSAENRTATAGVAPQGGPALGATLERTDNLKASTCTLIPYVFQIEQDSVFFDYFDQNDQGAQFIVEIAWDPAHVVVNPIAPPIREIDYTGSGDDFVPGVACESVEGNDYVHPEVGGGEVPWCLIDHQLVLTEFGWQQIQWWHGKGDPRWR